MTAVRLLVTGATGQVGGAFVRLAAQMGYACIAPDRTQCDLADLAQVHAFIAAHPCEAIVNCAAYTAVDQAEAEPELAQRINADAPGLLARMAAARDIPLLHISTDYVFNGSKGAPYTEDDAPAPINSYGASKLHGERAIAAVGGRYAIMRTAWVLSAGGRNFLTTMQALADTRESVRVVNDQCGCPTSARDIAEALLLMLESMLVTDLEPGIWHFVNGGTVTWYDVAEMIFAARTRQGLRTPLLTPIPTSAYPTPAQRPAQSVLATHKFQQQFGYVPRDWTRALDDLLAPPSPSRRRKAA